MYHTVNAPGAGVGPDARGLGLPFELASIRTNETTTT